MSQKEDDSGICWCGAGEYKPHPYGLACAKWEETEGEKERSVVAREHWLLQRVNALDVDPAEPTLGEVLRESRALFRELGAERLELVGAGVLLSQEVRALRLSLQELLLRGIHASVGSQSFEDAGMGSPAVEWQRKLAATEHALARALNRIAELEEHSNEEHSNEEVTGAVPARVAPRVEGESARIADLESECAALLERARAAEAEANILRAASAHTLRDPKR